MNKQLLLGAEAIAQAALDAGISGVYAYPGTPSTEITEYVQKSPQAKEPFVRSAWATNEKTAYEAALGMSYAGKRSLVCMKHVGLNVAADAFMNSSVTGIHGGLVIVVADDPSMHSSQNEQDSRVYGKFAMIPVLEPANQQETYNMTRHAFDLSEQTALPVLLRIPTRLSHSRAVVTRKETRPQNNLAPSEEKGKWILLPANARRNYQQLLEKQQQLMSLSESSPYNKIMEGTGKKAAIAFGIGYNYAMEVIGSYKLQIPLLKISQYPLPEHKIKAFCDQYDDILIVEEGYPVYEELLKGYFGNRKFRGRLDGALPRMGELSPAPLAKALGLTTSETKVIPAIVASRPPMLCQGCGHRDLFDALNLAMESYPYKQVFGDIGCYTLGALPPYNAISTCVDMGASITMAKGAADAGLRPAVCVIGDSTFTHSGMTGLLDAVNDRSSVTIIISDNDTTAMTGGQDSAGTGRFFDICKGLGVEEEHIRLMVPLKKNLNENSTILKEELDYNGVSVIISQRECVQTLKKQKKQCTKISSSPA
ncbi:MAG: indolepyruvate ferredoxin oxidoreductase [Bacteroidetes bacterium GWD2_45_23]|nr:MAG: indolepyruvate ferredoxin oxidoreductase [Bacteroidetes bacterium GWC2_46_850]OFX78663.1 MAG: indolepyruvate ferredoxin oxidoreductase [Bacteroidetes bacterium GWC1_47_7]OFX86193.1 MAG: indolepyruvate ferredoxin oxidoreductase [Bacteroidetes bacterium GWD2_45_23]HAR37186.1 indolepyruvate ferredoxin oxidoreductase [Porphyromonadaceae bacterium]HCC17325.1 indolepyruvate ferredoxin oxidoreductase [Porphyromonadaceae bacterium]